MLRKTLLLKDTFTKTLRPVSGSEDGVLRVYTCGPTVYDFAHLGNFRTFLVEDVLCRVLTWVGFRVIQVMNFTDIDDKIIKKVSVTGESLGAFTKKFKDAFLEDAALLRIQEAKYYPCATDYIEEMIEMIRCLEERGFAYKSCDGSVYFALDKFPEYGSLCHLHKEGLVPGLSKRVSQDEYDKDAIADFVLWKAFEADRDGSIYWNSPWGKGRPGWHIECSAMAKALLGPTLDLHCGGVDNIFPHHENEIAQSVCCHNAPLAKHWFHVEHLQVEGKKMAKSAGNFYTLRDLLEKGADPSALRYALLQHHYSSPMNFTEASLHAAHQAVERYRLVFSRLEEVQSESSTVSDDLIKLLAGDVDRFWEALLHDLNTPMALGALFDFIREVNRLIDTESLNQVTAGKILKMLVECDVILDLRDQNPIPNAVQQLVEKRKEARERKKWKESDRYRAELEELGFVIEDLPYGSRVRRKV
ncbi:cysteine--tRNA ligase [Candidatus Similichlamydia laticola]|uniref:Cysteine--tRNA ligase n=1 Tax=Candidatus Similichlamydia laticola TaxID=2170265 RepID=A0A369KIR9_9BACT|nr:cysteine--tRNA ligase [Candidatus Similichlamydia laticola]RDB31664.1 Cysteinyl-tRNA synthetase [Candidatus Similichlamydia laticola]